MDSVYDLLDEIETTLEESNSIPFTNKVMVDRDILFDIIREVRMNLPKEIENAKWVIQERNRIVIEAQRETEHMKEQVQDQLEELIDQHEVTKGAENRAAQIIDEAKQMSREIRLGALEYADELLAKLEQRLKTTLAKLQDETSVTEKFLNDSINTIFQNRQELRGPTKK